MELSPQIAGFISMLVGLGCGGMLAWSMARQHASKRWLTTQGEILQSNIQEDSDGWIPHIRYRYTVDQQDYTGKQIGFYTPNSGTEGYAKQQLASYPAGKIARVCYNPSNPQDAVLDRKIPLWRPIFWFFFTLFFGMGGVQMWRGAVL